jgi:hypothetical protein
LCGDARDGAIMGAAKRRPEPIALRCPVADYVAGLITRNSARLCCRIAVIALLLARVGNDGGRHGGAEFDGTRDRAEPVV